MKYVYVVAALLAGVGVIGFALSADVSLRPTAMSFAVLSAGFAIASALNSKN